MALLNVNVRAMEDKNADDTFTLEGPMSALFSCL